MDGFKVVKLNEVIRLVDIIITCTGNSGKTLLDSRKHFKPMTSRLNTWGSVVVTPQGTRTW